MIEIFITEDVQHSLHMKKTIYKNYKYLNRKRASVLYCHVYNTIQGIIIITKHNEYWRYRMSFDTLLHRIGMNVFFGRKEKEK